ncbi:hypothetical protein K431DRAFT_54689 [Polychaeton citri CBS 116435]|uniref:Amidohydrolase-related domain-containing protein n=1 Tax=Polychaeton citri CBS 116435 TaxID=1314669 RepID=A0A9P4UV80_9PEZI|nr:hypothetical protein K431DRAFT_54689 [Polychaeton citri CBS 116435]
MASFLIKDVRIFDGQQTVSDSGSVLVQDGKISKVSSSTIDAPSGIQAISKPGHTLLPGLIDAHIHANSGNTVALPQCLRFGVTTACDMHNEPYNIEKLRKQIRDEGDAVCADIKTTGFAATIEMGWPIPVVLAHDKRPETLEEIKTWPKLKTAEDAREYVQARLKENVDYIKLMHESGKIMGAEFNKPTVELQKAVIEEAHKHGLPVVAHSTCLDDTIEILEAGVDGLTHTFVDQPPNERLIAAYKKNNAHCTPTLACMGSGTTEGLAMQEKYAHDPRVQHLMGEEERARMCMCMSFAKESGSKCEYGYESVRQLKKAGIEIVCGSDAAGPAVGTGWGLSMHQELAIYVEHCGFTPAEALRAATFAVANRFNFKDRGQIKEGLKADLLLVEGNPLENIDHSMDLRGVWKNGVLAKAYEGKL